MPLHINAFHLVMGFSRALDLVNPVLAGHHLHVGYLADAVARKLDIDAEEALTRAGQRFTERFARMEEQANAQDKPLHTLSPEQQMGAVEPGKTRIT